MKHKKRSQGFKKNLERRFNFYKCNISSGQNFNTPSVRMKLNVSLNQLDATISIAISIITSVQSNGRKLINITIRDRRVAKKFQVNNY